jgi:hypothetical protein
MRHAIVFLGHDFLISLRQADIAQILQHLRHGVDEIIMFSLGNTEACVIKSSDQSRTGA